MNRIVRALAAQLIIAAAVIAVCFQFFRHARSWRRWHPKRRDSKLIRCGRSRYRITGFSATSAASR